MKHIGIDLSVTVTVVTLSWQVSGCLLLTIDCQIILHLTGC